MQWWSILDTEPKKGIFFFVSFGLDGLKHFITLVEMIEMSWKKYLGQKK